MQRTERKDVHLHYFVQDPLPSLIFAVAEETVCVDVVRVAVQLDVQVVRSLEILLDREGNLCGRSPEVHGPDGLFPFWVCVDVPKVFLQV